MIDQYHQHQELLRENLRLPEEALQYRCFDFSTSWEMLDRQTRRLGERPALYYRDGEEEKTVTFSQLRDTVCSLGAWLWEQNYRRQNIAIVGKNSYPYAVLLLALLGSDSTAALVNPGLPAESIAEMVNMVDADVVFCDADVVDKIPAGKKMHLLHELPLQFDRPDRYTCGYDAYCPAEEDIALLLFSSGTTGRSKAVMLSHGAIAASVRDEITISSLYTDVVLLLPFFHVLGLTIGFLNILALGVGNYINTDARRMFADIARIRPNAILMAPIQLELLWKVLCLGTEEEAKQALGGRLAVIYSGGSVVKDDVADGLARLGIAVCSGYGMTECIAVTVPSREHCSYLSAGAPKSVAEIRIADPDASGRGEILIRGKTLFSGYYKDPDATAQIMPDGWMHSGDIGYFDDNGCLYVVGRIKNLIILGSGENVSPEELEDQLMRSSAIAECRVFEEEDTICAELVPAKDVGADRVGALTAWVKEINSRYPSSHHISRVYLSTEPLEKTAIGKVRRDSAPNREMRIL